MRKLQNKNAKTSCGFSEKINMIVICNIMIRNLREKNLNLKISEVIPEECDEFVKL